MFDNFAWSHFQPAQCTQCLLYTFISMVFMLMCAPAPVHECVRMDNKWLSHWCLLRQYSENRFAPVDYFHFVFFFMYWFRQCGFLSPERWFGQGYFCVQHYSMTLVTVSQSVEDLSNKNYYCEKCPIIRAKCAAKTTPKPTNAWKANWICALNAMHSWNIRWVNKLFIVKAKQITCKRK